MTKKPVTGRILALLTAVLTMTVMCLPASAFAANGVTKDETVYVVTDSSGTQQDVIVSDHLINKGKVKTIEDKTNLKDIENVKGEETFKQDGESLTWDAEGNGIYYQGRSEDEIPVAMDIVYRLNDKVVTGSELQGQSGKVEIKINYTNDAEFEGTTVPFVVMTGMVITDDSFKNIKVTKGKVIDDGDKLMVVGMAAPGLAQTLDIGESDLGIGSSVTITGDADKFAVEEDGVYFEADDFKFKVHASLVDGLTAEVVGYMGDSESFTIPDEVNGLTITAIGNIAENTNGEILGLVNEITIPQTITSIDVKAMSAFSAVESFYVYSSNPSFMDINGVVFDKMGKKLVLFPSARTEYDLPKYTAASRS